MVVKKDGRRERFEREKVLAGLLRASERRPVSMIQLEAIADKAELLAQESPEREVSAESLGETIMTELKQLDKVAYVRFASVYLDFKDVQEFMSELQDLLRNRD
jgi:transcriptional repressor NrdR